MSYRGRPSKGCEPCRARKVKVGPLFAGGCSRQHPVTQDSHLLLTVHSVTKQNLPVIDAPRRTTSASTATRQIFSSGIRRHSLPSGLKTRGGNDRKATSEH